VKGAGALRGRAPRYRMLGPGVWVVENEHRDQ
jgi:hypothetical protein